ncbi:hypothetical protein, unlikely [Trypanosoma brucei gambiense DAL972]|uniref:Uncharacterized protein n=1 Tax=Trypanosoma brucei gambiense (strain MHOM/CI/86/DAL972) TaxID=679716 RepID=C9ZNU1_TRYB9|nr:hypothetical protein, unlikely [Trypanosoma brucei gambiense DAL972]CBH11069.1 hypothetical protein, unlikely [Trypanosoma brucei gambiense DAL972]|eukprot:XP_011773356.1 hypothetical protein, unlikely [Trypanosoma brucei gambiense DAL972]
MLMERHCVDKPANGLNLILFEQVHHRRKEGKYINGFGLGESIHVDSIAGTMGSCVVVRKGVYSPVGCFTTGCYFYTKKKAHKYPQVWPQSVCTRFYTLIRVHLSV